MTKRKTSTGLKLPNNGKTIHIGDTLKFTVNDKTSQDFHKHQLGRVLKETGYGAIFVTIDKHKWLELDMNAFVLASNDLLAEQGLVLHVASGGDKEVFDHEYKTTAPMMYSEPLMDTSFLRFMLDQNLTVEKFEGIDEVKARSVDFYSNAAQEIFTTNEELKEAV